jgi:hypothetical protein
MKNKVRCPNWASFDCDGCRHADPHIKQDECGSDGCPTCKPCGALKDSIKPVRKKRERK